MISLRHMDIIIGQETIYLQLEKLTKKKNLDHLQSIKDGQNIKLYCNHVLDVLSKQKNDLRKLMLKNNNISRRLNYINNNSQINGSPIKDLNKIFMPNINNKSAPKKINNYKLIKKNYYIHNPPYLKNIEKYQKNANKLDYDQRKNYNVNIINNKNEYLPKLPRRLSPINKNIANYA